MAVNVKKQVGGGLAYVFWGIIDSNGYLQGSSTTTPSNGDQDGSIMAQLQGASSFPWAPSTAQSQSVEADDGAIAHFMFYPTELPTAQAVFRASDYDFDAACETMLVHDVGQFSVIPRGGYQPTYRDMCFLVISQSKTLTDTGIASGLSHWEALFVGPTNVQPQGRAERASATVNADYNYQITSNFASQYPTGVAFSASNIGTTKTPAFDFTSPYKPIFQRWNGDNSETTFNLGKNIAEDSANNIRVFVDGTEITWVTGVPGAGEFGITEGATDTAVFGTAPGTSSEIVAWFGWS